MNLKPCPFCGASDPEYIQHPLDGWRHGIGCTNCGCRVGYITHHSNKNWADELADWWNDRALSDSGIAMQEFSRRVTRFRDKVSEFVRENDACVNECVKHGIESGESYAYHLGKLSASKDIYRWAFDTYGLGENKKKETGVI